MKTKRNYLFAARTFIGCSTVSLLSVAVLAWRNPQEVMDLVQVKLTNNDALSSIRGVYGGVGLTLCVGLIYMWVQHPKMGVSFLTLFWGSYALSRLLTMAVDGPLGDFGSQWIVIETLFCLIGVVLLFFGRKLALTTTHERG